MINDRLERIKALQHSDKAMAEQMALAFIREVYAQDVTSVELRPLAVSLNSFNGYLTHFDGRRLFFKTHTEADTVIGEYYQAGLLADAGYPVIRPVFSSTEVGKQLLIYELVEDPSVFDVAWQIENGDKSLLPLLTDAQHKADDALFTLYETTFDVQNADAAAAAPIHQLFYHRLAGGRLERFYGIAPNAIHGTDVEVNVPGGRQALSTVRSVHWRINGQRYTETLDQLISQATETLAPHLRSASIIGHGDAHNGNVFLRHTPEPSLVYFDPAFAGRHHPLLDLTKPLFHNVFAMWMYFPQEKRRQLEISLAITDTGWDIEYHYDLPDVRQMFLGSKIERVLFPTLKMLKSAGWLDANWRALLKAALFCCPLLTMNLKDNERFPAEISLLGLSMAVEMGAESKDKRSLIDQLLDQAAEVIL